MGLCGCHKCYRALNIPQGRWQTIPHLSIPWRQRASFQIQTSLWDMNTTSCCRLYRECGQCVLHKREARYCEALPVTHRCVTQQCSPWYQCEPPTLTVHGSGWCVPLSTKNDASSIYLCRRLWRSLPARVQGLHAASACGRCAEVSDLWTQNKTCSDRNQAIFWKSLSP